MNPYRDRNPGTVERPTPFLRRRMPAWLGALVILLVASGVKATPTPALRLNGVDMTNVSYASGNLRLQLGNVGGTASYGIVESMAPTDALGVATWYDTVGRSLFHGTRYDWTRDIGWNLAMNGTRIDTGDAAVGDQWESYYEQDASNTWLERHVIYIDTTGTAYRPWSFQMGRTGGTATNGGVVNGYIAAGSFALYDSAGPVNSGASYFRFATNPNSGVSSSGWLEIATGGTFRKLTNNAQWLWQMNAAANNQLSIAYVDASNQVEVGVGSSAGGDAAGVIIGGTSSTTAIQSTATTIDTGGNQWEFQFGSLFPTTNFNGAVGTAAKMPGSIRGMQIASKTQTVAAATNLTLNPGGGGENFRITLSATAISTVTVSAGLAGECIHVSVIEDATGTRTIPTTWTNVHFAFVAAANTYVATTTASRHDVLTLCYDDSAAYWNETSRAVSLVN